MAEEKKDETPTPIPNWDAIDKLATKVEVILFEEADKEELTIHDRSIILNRVQLLFDEYKLRAFINAMSHGNLPEQKDGDKENPTHFQ